MKDFAYKIEVELNSKLVSPEIKDAIEQALIKAGRAVVFKTMLIADGDVCSCTFKKWSADFNPEAEDGYVNVPLTDD